MLLNTLSHVRDVHAPVNLKIFREYDIRGVFEKDFTPMFAALLGHALVEYLKGKNIPNTSAKLKIAVGKDARPSGNILSSYFIQALLKQGVEALDLGIVPTPLVYFSSVYLKVDAAISITGSHNPSEYNGFKISVGTSTLHGEQIQEIAKLCKNLIENFSFTFDLNSPQKATPVDVITPYMQDVCSKIQITKPLTVVLDAGNGTAACVAPILIQKLGCRVIPLFCELDGGFPNHHPDPTVLENLKDLQKAVLEHKADVGIAYDGDADRIGVVDECGKPIYGDELLVLFAREILMRKPGATILSEVKCSSRMYDDIRRHGGKAIMWKTGHSLIKSKMKEENAELAGEMSGHMFFSDRYYGYDDAIYASARLLEILCSSHKTLSQHLADLPPSFCTPEIRVDCEDHLKFKIVEDVKNQLLQKYKIIDIDGVRIETSEGWGLLRASNTQPVVVMRFEAFSQEALKKIQKTIEDAFTKARNTVTA